MEEVVLVDEANHVLSTMPKNKIHGEKTPLHRAFSLYIFNEDNKLLLQQRSNNKKTWPLFWSNSCCGHPALNESNINAAIRRANFELGINVFNIIEMALYRYTFHYNEITENEICPILKGVTNEEPNINFREVNCIRWITWSGFINDKIKHPQKYAPWCIEQADILNQYPQFKELLSQSN